MKRSRRNLQVILVAAILMIAGISVAFAAMSTALTITTNSVKNDGTVTWNIGFTGSSATPTAGGTSATGRVCGNATITSTSVTVAQTTLSKPDDSCTYTLTIKNSGTITGTLTNIQPTQPTSTTCSTASGATMVCGNITYKLTTDAAGNTALTTGGTLAANATRTIYLSIKYTGTTLGSAFTQSAGAFTLTYSQT